MSEPTTILLAGYILCGFVTFLLIMEFLSQRKRQARCAGIVVLRAGRVVQAEIMSSTQLEPRYFQGQRQRHVLRLSGLNPHITPQDAFSQTDRIAQERAVEVEEIHSLLNEYLDGGRGMNILFLNHDLDHLMPPRKTKDQRP